ENPWNRRARCAHRFSFPFGKAATDGAQLDRMMVGRKKSSLHFLARARLPLFLPSWQSQKYPVDSIDSAAKRASHDCTHADRHGLFRVLSQLQSRLVLEFTPHELAVKHSV